MTLPLPMLADALTDRGIATTPEVDALLAANAPVAIGVSGGKDSSAVAIATAAHLDRISHTGPRILVHADLGVVEWQDSLPTCERLARRLGMELVVVRRKQGDMMQRWEQRWQDNVSRWLALSCVKLILPWSTPAMRFCTSHLKTNQICPALVQRFPGKTILSVTGIRRAESTERAKRPISQPNAELKSVKHKTTGIDWHPIIEWSTPDVFEYAKETGFPLHEAYERFGTSRVSCMACILATAADHRAAAKDDRNRDTLRRMADLEIRSTFAFQGNRWLSDTLAAALTPEQLACVQDAKDRGGRREEAEARIPDHMLYHKGWPTCVPTVEEAALLGEVRSEVADAVGLDKTFTQVEEIRGRYSELLAEKARKDAEKAARAERKSKNAAKSKRAA